MVSSSLVRKHTLRSTKPTPPPPHPPTQWLKSWRSWYPSGLDTSWEHHRSGRQQVRTFCDFRIHPGRKETSTPNPRSSSQVAKTQAINRGLIHLGQYMFVQSYQGDRDLSDCRILPLLFPCCSSLLKLSRSCGLYQSPFSRGVGLSHCNLKFPSTSVSQFVISCRGRTCAIV